MKVGIYGRVSREDLQIENQLRDLRQAAADKGWEVVDEYLDRGVKGDEKKPELTRLLQDAHVGRVQLVIVWSLDRLSRSGALDALQTLDRFEKQGVAYWFLKEQYLDSSMPFHSTMAALIADIAAFEKRRLVERTRAGLARARAQGRILGRPRRSYPVSPSQVAQERADGASWGVIAKKHGLAKTSVRRLVQKGQAELDRGHRKGRRRT